MWVYLAFLSAAMLGLYDVAKKRSLKENAVLPVLWLNTLFSTIIFTPALLDAEVAENPRAKHHHGLQKDHSVVAQRTSRGFKECTLEPPSANG